MAQGVRGMRFKVAGCGRRAKASNVVCWYFAEYMNINDRSLND